MIVPDAANMPPTPWQELYRSTVGQHATGACMEIATRYQNIAGTVGVARDNH
jgi:dihydroxy-acid dehydratase